MSELLKDMIAFDKDRELDMIFLGRAAIDMNPVDYFKPLSQSQTFRKYVGGSPANTAVGLARLGKKCGFLSKVSNDSLGDFVIEYLKQEKIDTSHIFRCKNGEKMGLAFTEILSPSRSSILMYRSDAADLSLEPGDIDEEYISSAKALLISGTALAKSPSREAALKAAALAQKTGTPLIFDIDYRPYDWKTSEETAVYYFAIAREAAIIMGSREEYDRTEQFLGLDGTDLDSARYWTGREKGKIIVIKHGKDGSAAYTRGGSHYSVKPFPVQALKSFGGGDGYAASFLYGVLEGINIMDALEMGSAEASMLVASHGCSDDMPDIRQLKEFMKQQKEKYGQMAVKV